MRYLAVDAAPTLPRRVRATPELHAATEAAIAKWNAIRPGTFELAPWHAPAAVDVVPSMTRTWVSFVEPWPRAVVLCGPDLADWLPHEMGHALGLADHVPPEMVEPGHVNPVIADDSNPYWGVMRYWTRLDQWFGPDDVAMMREVFPLAQRVVLPGVAS